MNRVLCSTGAVVTRKNGLNYGLLPEFAEKLCCDGFELMMSRSWYENFDTVYGDISKMGLLIPTVHSEKGIGELISAGDAEAYRRFELDCRAAEMVGAKLLVLHLWNGLVSDSNFSENLRAYKRLRKIAEGHGLLLTVENVVCNVLTPMKRLRELAAEYPDISFTFDTKMAAFHGELEEIYDEDFLKKHVKHLHINDYGGGVGEWSALRTLHLGCGNIDFDGFFAFVRKTGYSGDFTVEATSVNDDGSVDIDKLNRDFLKIKGYIA